MSRKRFAPLINVGVGLLAVGETVGRAITGDGEGALDSAAAAGVQLLCGLAPYLKNDSKINMTGTVLNGAWGASLYAKILTTGKFSKSFSYNAFPIISLLQMGTNAGEYAIKDKEK